MPHFTSYDGAALAYRVLGGADLPPLVCLAGGPGRDAAYLGSLGGLDAHRRLIVPDARGTGQSPPAGEAAAHSFPRLAEDVEALREALGIERFALLAHDAAAATAQAYAAAHPERLSHLVLVCPGGRLQGGTPEDAQRIFMSRFAEPWWRDAADALQAAAEAGGPAAEPGLPADAAPMAYGRWERAQQEHAAAEAGQWHPVPRGAFWQGVDEQARRAVLDGLGRVGCPVLVVTGERDAISGTHAGELVAGCFRQARLVPLLGAGHYPWVDEPGLFRELVAGFLGEQAPGPAGGGPGGQGGG